jgi:LysR family transcriptional regulator, hydrogen peroxide-inducible genes activator
MELEQLRQFVQVADLKNFTRAAAACDMSQPALSRSIIRLEEELGQPLFDRQPRNVALTDAGKLLLGRARQILAMVDDVTTAIGDDGHTGKLRIGAIPTIAPYFLPKYLARFRELCPEATLIVQEETTERLLKSLSDGAVELAIAALPIDAKYLKAEKLFNEELYLVLAADHPLCKKTQLKIADIQSLPFVLLGEAHCLTESVVSFCHQKSFHPVTVERTSQLAMVQELVALNHGISLIPAMARELDLSKRREYRSLSGTKPMRTIVLVTNPYRFQSQLQIKFEKLLKQ